MSAISNSQSFPLPRVTEALKPFIKTRQEVLHIRRVLSLYLASHIEGLPNGDLSLTSLATPGSQVRVKRIPPELTGVASVLRPPLQNYVLCPTSPNPRLNLRLNSNYL